MKSLIDSLLRIFVAALLAGATVVAVASDPTGEYTIFGTGTNSCGKLMESYNKDTPLYGATKHWVTGYATAFGAWNDTKKPLVAVAEVEGMMLIIRQYCHDNPLSDTASAALFMAQQVLEKVNE